MAMGFLKSFDPTNDDSAVKQGLGKASSQQPQMPKPSDYEPLIQAQAEANRVNQVGPHGSSTYSTGADGRPVLTNSFSPEVQGLFNQQTSMAGSNISDAGDVYGGSGDAVRAQLARAIDPSGFNDQVQSAYSQRAMNTLDPQFEQQRRQNEQRLVDQGIPIGSEAHNEAMNRMDASQNLARENVALSAVGAGNQAALAERGVNLGELSTAANLGMQGQQQQYGQDFSTRQQQFNELSSVLGNNQTGTPTGLDVTGPANMAMNNSIAGQQQKGQQKSSNTNAASNLGAAYFASDRRAKKDCEVIGRVKGGNLYKFKYLWSKVWNYGVMSDEVSPDLLLTLPSGYHLVNYRGIYA